ncbi:MAG: HD domain-containing protein [Candidatus Shapirobacteria bacterium]|nr:HD domain-containing protein [Candidatus Shapirobacteria bacterium]
MTIKDNIYGKYEVKEPVLLDILKNPSINRLKRISQYGIPDKYYHFENYSRYEHSVGAMLLLRKLGATLEEQVAGLLHDVSVLAFSHIADWVFGDGPNGTEGYHNRIHAKFVKSTDIPKILKKYGFRVERILNEENYSLLERNIPDLCADRVDYALREFKYWLNPKIVKECLNSLVNYNGEIVFTDKGHALDFANNYLELQTQHWGGYESMIRYHLFSEMVKLALEEKIVAEKDFFEDEPFVLGKIEASKHKGIQEKLSLLKKRDLSSVKRASGKKVFKKFRFVNPKVLVDEKLQRLTELTPGFKKVIEKHRKINLKGLMV